MLVVHNVKRRPITFVATVCTHFNEQLSDWLAERVSVCVEYISFSLQSIRFAANYIYFCVWRMKLAHFIQTFVFRFFFVNVLNVANETDHEQISFEIDTCMKSFHLSQQFNFQSRNKFELAQKSSWTIRAHENRIFVVFYLLVANAWHSNAIPHFFCSTGFHFCLTCQSNCFFFFHQ